MRKISKILYLTLMLLVISVVSVSASSTSEALNEIQRENTFFELYGKNPTAPIVSNGAGNETVQMNFGSVNYDATDLILQGKNGFDFKIERKFEGSNAERYADNYINGKDTMTAMSTLSYGLVENISLVFRYYKENDINKTSPYYVLFDSVTELRDQEYEPGKLSVRFLENANTHFTTKLTADIGNRNTVYWKRENQPFTVFYRVHEITGNDEILIRDTTFSPYELTSASNVNACLVEADHFNSINFGAGWSMYLPSLEICGYSFSDDEDEYIYDFFDPDMCAMSKYEVTVKYKKNTNEVSQTQHKIENKSYRIINNTAVPEKSNQEFCIERYDGVRFYFDGYGKLLKKEDKFGNTVQYDITKTVSTITDSYGRIITIDQTQNDIVKIYVDGVLHLVYEREYINDENVDPLEEIVEDDKMILIVNKIIDSQNTEEYKYTVSNIQNIWQLTNGKKNQYKGHAKLYFKQIDKIELPTGGVVCYEYERAETDRNYLANALKDISFIKKRYEKTTPDSSEVYNESRFTCGYTKKTMSTSARYISYTYEKGKSISETYNANSMLLEKRETTHGKYNDKITETFTYWKFNNFRSPLVTNTYTNIYKGENININNDITYDNNCQKLSEKITSNEVTQEKLTAYNDYGLIAEQKELQSNGVYVGVKNTFSEDGKKIVKSQSFKQTGENYEYFDTTLFEYNDFGEVIKTTKINGEDEIITNISYNYQPEEAGVLLTKETTVNDVENIDGKTSLSTLEKYDNYFNLIYAKSSEDNVTEYTYDLLGRVTSVKTPDGFYSYTAYDSVNNEIILTDKNGGKQKIKYDALGKEKETYIYDNGYKLVKEINYDEFSRPVKISLFDDASGSPYSSIFYEYNKDGSVKSETVKENGNILSKKEYDYTILNSQFVTTSNVYKTNSDKSVIKQYSDAFGNVLSQEYENGDKTYSMNMTYDLMGNLLTSEDFRANDEGYENKTVSKNTYDYAGRNIKTEMLKPDGSYMESLNEYDLFGNLVKTTDFNGNATEIKYNKLGQQIEVITPVDDNVTSKTKYFYNGDGLNTKIYTQNNKPNEEESYILTQNIYDNVGNLICVIANDGLLDNITKYEYNNLGNITKMVLGLTSVNEEINPEIHQITNYTYNNLNQLISVTSSEGITTHFTYDYLGQNLSKYNDNVNTSYIYDGLGRVKEINATGNSKDETVSYTYDLMGNIKSMTDSSGETYYTYDSLGQLIKEQKGNDIKSYTYDANGNRKNFKLNNEINLVYTYDILNRLISVSDGSDTVTYSYDNNGNLLSENGAVDVDYQYNKAGQIISKINSTVNGNIDNFSVSYYLNGNISDITENDKVTSYVYDNLGRLTKETVSNEGETLYSYDRFSNRNSKVETDLEGNIISQSDYLYNKNNQLLSEISGNKTTNYSYDINGNLIFKTYTELSDVENGENTFTMGNILPNYIEEYIYDALNRLSAFNTSQINASYTYDGNGLRQTKTVNGITENHIYDGQNIVKSGNQTFVRGNSLISRKVDGNKEFYSFNVHGDTTKLVSQSGTVLKDYSYDAFGNQKTENENDTNPFRYCGEYFDNETGLIYLRARYYDTSAGRFISEDPIKDGLNWYVYCSNNPVNFWDPLGLDPGDIFDTMDEAALDAGNYYMKKTISNDEEMCGIIYQSADGKYIYYDIENTSENKKLGFYVEWYGNPVGFIHTHVFYDVNNPNNEFSTVETTTGLEGDDITFSMNNMIPIYMAAPTGELKKYDPNTQECSHVGNIIMDPKYEIYEHLKNTFVWKKLESNFSAEQKIDIVKRITHLKCNNRKKEVLNEVNDC